MSPTFSDLIAAAKPGSTIDLGKNTGYQLTPTPTAPRAALLGQKPLTITGDGVELLIPHSPLRERPGLSVRGPNVHLVGDVTLVFPDEPRNAKLEGQHGIELLGAHDCTIGWKTRNQQGTGLYFGKDPRLPADPTHANWCQRITVLPTFSSTNAGRGHIELQAIVGATIDTPLLDTAGHGHSAIGFESNGHDWGCHNVTIKRPRYRGNMGFALSLGSGSTSQPDHNATNVVLLDGVSEQPFGIHLDGRTQRMGPVVIGRCRGGGLMNTRQVRAWAIDHLYIVEYHQRTSMGDPFELHDCPNAVTSLAA